MLQASDGNFYGTTYSGGDDGNGCVQGCAGTVFKITPQGQFTLLYTFVGGGTRPAYQNGCNPSGGLVEGPDGYLYGTTFQCGRGPYGVFYKISKTGEFHKLYDFACGTANCGGTNPQGKLVLGRDGYFYGTTTSPPAYPQIFRISSAGVYTTIKNLYNTGLGTPQNGMVQASDGNLYGVAVGGIYRVTPPFGFAPVYFFGLSDGRGNSELIQATDGFLYGATYPSPANRGFVFRIALDGTQHQNILALGNLTTGVVPNALLQASDGNLWGTTYLGGTSGLGFVYATTTSGTLLQSLPLTAPSTGIRSMAPLIQGTDGKLYGTTSSYGPGSGSGSGTIFVVDAGLAPPNQVSVPDVVALSQADAMAAITNAGLTVGTITTASSNSIPAGSVISESPSAATIVTAGSAVNLTISSGALQVSVPNVVGMTQADASTAITAAGLAGGTVTTAFSSTVASGTVISQSPPAGTQVSPASVVNLVVSSGPAPGPAVNSLQVLFGNQSYDVTTSTRHSLPWQVTGIRVVFSEPIAGASAGSLSGVNVAGFSGLGTDTLTWAITPVALANLVLGLSGSGPNAILDASGAGLAAGAGFTQALSVLWGDFNDDGVVTAADLAGVNNATAAPYDIFADMNGDGVVSVADVRVVRARLGTFLFK